MKILSCLLFIGTLAGFSLCDAKAQSPVISYLIPDIGAPGMNTYVEIIAPYNANGRYGTDGVYANNSGDQVRLVCSNPGDTSKIVIGPVFVSWQGRVISSQVFVRACEAPTSSDWTQAGSQFSVPLDVIVNGAVSNSDTFFIVKPAPALIVSGGGIIGSGGQWGTRSKRGALIFDSISLGSGTYTISTADCDPVAPGNQGFLPAVILSKGNVTLSSGAILSGSSTGKNGGPGGGGGSMGDGPVIDSGGFGFVGGAPGESSSAGPCQAIGGMGTGGIGDVNAGGIGMNKITPEPSDVLPNCEYYGGTGNPFVSEGGGVVTHNKHEGDGNGGGFGTAGEDGRGERGNFDDVGGIVNGNPMLIPLMGGSGGGGGNEFCTCDEDPSTIGAAGGGGGGGICIFGTQINSLNGSIQVNGASGVTGGVGCVGHGSVGGCGSGGGLLLEAKLNSTSPSVSAAGGISIHTHLEAGNGGAGRVRFDGPMTNPNSILPNTATIYRGLSTDTSHSLGSLLSLHGTGNGDSIRIYTKTGSGQWQIAGTVGGYTQNAWAYQFPTNPTQATYIVAMQQEPNPSNVAATLEPSWVMSQAAANIIGDCCTAGPTALVISSNRLSVTQSSCTPVDTSVQLLIIGCGSPTGFIDSLWLDGAQSFKIADTRKAPRMLSQIDSVLFSYSGTQRSDTARLHIIYDLDSAIHDTIVTIVGSIGSPLFLAPVSLHREVGVSYFGTLDSLPLGIDINSSVNIDSLWPYLHDISGTYSFDSAVVTASSYLPPNGWNLSSFQNRGNAVDFGIHNVSSTSPSQPVNLGTALFQPAYPRLETSDVTLTNLIMHIGNQSIAPCIASDEDQHWSFKVLVTDGVNAPENATLQNSLSLSVYPNPAAGSIWISSSNDLGDVTIVVYDLLGEERGKIETRVIKDNPIELKLPDADGIYNILVKSSDRMSSLRVVRLH